MFGEGSVILREICNGIMCISAVMIIGIFIHYVWRGIRENPHWYRDPVIQSAGAIIILLTGHAMRAFSGWMQFLWLDIGWDPDFWANSMDIFVVATALIIGAKLLMVSIFAPGRWRALLTNSALVFSIGIPVVIALVVAEQGKAWDISHPQITSAELVDLPKNGRMTIRYKAKDPSRCPIEVDIAISQAATDAVVWRHRGTATRVSEEWLAEVNVPNLPPGDYLYYTTFRAKCSETRIYTSEAEAVPFKL